MLHVSKCAPMQLLRFLKSSWKIFSTSAPFFSAGRLKFQLSRRNHKTLPPTCVACAFVVHTRYTFMIQGRGWRDPLLLPLLGENPPKMGSGHFGSMAKMEFNRWKMKVWYIIQKCIYEEILQASKICMCTLYQNMTYARKGPSVSDSGLCFCWDATRGGLITWKITLLNDSRIRRRSENHTWHPCNQNI